jgi:two-component system sensor histidine kinase UhpB
LLDIAPEELTAKPHLLLEMILPADREPFIRSMQESAASLDVWNWEGGLWIEKWQDVKSVNLRATASRNLHGKVQWAGVITNITQSKNEKMALDEITNRFKAIVSNIPSLVFQCFLNDQNQISFNYLSDGCQALLGIDPDTLFMQPNKLLEIIQPEDRDSFINSMKKSARDLSIWNWEGGLWIEEWQDIKLINLRASTMVNAQGQVQWGGVITNITQSKKEKQEIERSHQQLEELSSHMALVKEQERLRIAREIHDDLGGNLTTIKIGLASLIKSMEKHQPELIEKARQLEKLVDNTFDDAHRITADLRPNVLELGIVAALEWQAKEFEKQIGIPFTFSTNDENLNLDVDRSIVLFRICQEATSNIAKYAKADSVEVDLIHQANEIFMQVSDDGLGIKPEDKLKRNAFGVRGMVERVQAVGGQISIEPGPICGTRVLVRLPL